MEVKIASIPRITIPRELKEEFTKKIKIKILGICMSPRQRGGPEKTNNTEILVKEVLKSVTEEPGIETEYIRPFIDYKILGGCAGCYICWKDKGITPDKLCRWGPYKDDDMNKLLLKVLEADGYVFGAPVYFGTIPWSASAFLSRWHPIMSAGPYLRNKVACMVTSALGRNYGQEATLLEFIKWCLQLEMIPVVLGSREWPSPPGFGSPYGVTAVQGGNVQVSSIKPEGFTAVRQDAIAMRACRDLGKELVDKIRMVKTALAILGEEGLVRPAGFGEAPPEKIPAEDLHYWGYMGMTKEEYLRKKAKGEI